MAVIIFLIARDSDNRSVIRVLTLGLDLGDRDVVIIFRIIFAFKRRTEICGPDSGGQIAIFDDLVLEQLRTRKASPNQIRVCG